jgi:hypothetical protein
VRRGDEVARLLRRIQALTLELAQHEQRATGDPEIDAKKRAREQLRWQLAAAARRAASDDLGAAA